MMGFFRRRKDGGRSEQGSATTAPAATCQHVNLVPSWDSGEDIGKEDRVSSYRCQVCGETFSPEEERTLRGSEADRIRRGLEERPDLAARYPSKVTLSDRREIELRLLSPSDGAALTGFMGTLPADDLLFLREDLTDRAVVDQLLGNVAAGGDLGIVAEAGSDIVGVALLHREPARWTRNVGEIRLMVAEEYRGNGLGGNLAREVIRVAPALGSRKVTAQMTVDQTRARAAFDRLGFVDQAILNGWVTDRRGLPRDLLVMALDLSDPGDASGATQ